MIETRTLFDAALDALEKEDKALNACFKLTDATVAKGLTYWLFETTLVYVIFKAWLRHESVFWEHAIGDPTLRPKAPVCGRSGAHEKCDLAIVDTAGTVVAAFEAKWWNDDSSKTWRALVDDANKLRRGFRQSTVEKYLLTFWWGTESSWERDLKAAQDACAADGSLLLVHADRFATQLLTGAGYFALGMIHVR